MQKGQVFAHLCTWFSSKEYSGKWEMWNSDYEQNPHNPDNIRYNGERDVACSGYPLNGTYDSNDPKAIEYQLQLMKLCGIDGVIVDWDGRRINAYRHERFLSLVRLLGKYDLKLIVCFEEWCGYYPENTYATRQEQLDVIIQEITYLYQTLVKNNLYANIDGAYPLPIFRKVAKSWLTNEEWRYVKSKIKEYNFSIYFNDCYDNSFASVADGYFFWVGGFDCNNANTLEFMLKEQVSFKNKCRELGKPYIPSVSPGFDDTNVWGWGEQARVAPRYDGKRYELMWQNVLKEGSKIVQIVTFNDWNEGSQIEPSSYYGYEYLEMTKEYVSKFKGTKAVDNSVLRLPLIMYGKKISGDKLTQTQLINKLQNIEE